MATTGVPIRARVHYVALSRPDRLFLLPARARTISVNDGVAYKQISGRRRRKLTQLALWVYLCRHIIACCAIPT
jgi:hypothetical protein